MKLNASNIPKLRFSEFTNEWTEKKLGNVSDVRDGTHDSPKYHTEGYPLITSKNLRTDGLIDFDNINLISYEDFKNINKRSKIDIGDILFGMIGTIGNPVIVKNDKFAIKNVALIKEKQDLINGYLYQYLKSAYISKKFYQKNAGGTQKFIALGLIRDLDIPTPSLLEQQKIADFFSTIDDWINNLRTQKEQFEKYKKGMMQRIFSQKIRFKDEKGKNYPEWEDKKLGDFYEITSSKRVFESEWTKSGVPFYRAREVVKLSENGYVDNELFISKEMYEKYKNKYGAPKEDDILITGVGTLGKTYVVKKNDIFYFKDGNIVWLKSKNLFNSSLIKHLFDTRLIKKQISNNASLSTVGTFTIDTAKKIKIKTPILPEQQKIADFLTLIDKIIEAKQKKIADAKIWKKGLMQQMFV